MGMALQGDFPPKSRDLFDFFLLTLPIGGRPTFYLHSLISEYMLSKETDSTDRIAQAYIQGTTLCELSTLWFEA